MLDKAGRAGCWAARCPTAWDRLGAAIEAGEQLAGLKAGLLTVAKDGAGASNPNVRHSHPDHTARRDPPSTTCTAPACYDAMLRATARLAPRLAPRAEAALGTRSMSLQGMKGECRAAWRGRSRRCPPPRALTQPARAPRRLRRSRGRRGGARQGRRAPRWGCPSRRRAAAARAPCLRPPNCQLLCMAHCLTALPSSHVPRRCSSSRRCAAGLGRGDSKRFSRRRGGTLPVHPAAGGAPPNLGSSALRHGRPQMDMPSAAGAAGGAGHGVADVYGQ